MKYTPKFSKADIVKSLRAKKEAFQNAVLSRLRFIGETFITNARSNDTYKDQTGNLRSSIGYLILKDGKQFEASFPGDKSAGRDAAKKVVADVSGKHPKGLVLIVVAGMEYALYVEATGRDVLTASGIAAENDLKKAVEKLSKKAA